MKKLLLVTYKERSQYNSGFKYNLDVADYIYRFYLLDLENKKYYNFGEEHSFIPGAIEHFLNDKMLDITDDQFNEFLKIKFLGETKKEWMIKNNLQEWLI
jgi:hypothetical protein